MAMLEKRTSAVARLQGEPDSLRAERDSFRTERDTANAEVEKLQLIIKELMRSRYGTRSEKLDPDQLQLALEEIAQSLGLAQSIVDSEPVADRLATSERKPAQRNRGALPPHLPRVEVVIDVEDKHCPCCGGAMHVIGEDVAEMLDIVPALYEVKVIRRPRGARPRESGGCRGSESAVVQAPAPERPLTGGMASAAVLAQVLVAKYSDHLPLYREAQIFTRHGIDLDRSTPAAAGAGSWPIGSGAPAGGCARWPSCCSAPFSPRPSCSPTARRCRCSIPGAAAPRPGGCGLMPATTARGRARCHPQSPMFTARTARARTGRTIWPPSAGYCKMTAMPGSMHWAAASGRPVPYSSPSAGRMPGASSSISTTPPARRSPPRRCGGSPKSIRLRSASVAARPISASASARPRAGHWSRYLRDVLERIVSGKTKANELSSLLPWAWKASQTQAAVNT
jgi:transposase